VATKLWIRTYEDRPAILVQVEGDKVCLRVDDKERAVSKSAWDQLPFWTGPSPFLNEGRHDAS
jgi:hypothetical protein